MNLTKMGGHKNTKHFNQIYSSLRTNNNIHVLWAGYGKYDVFDQNFNFLYSYNSGTYHPKCFVNPKDQSIYCHHSWYKDSVKVLDSFICFDYLGARMVLDNRSKLRRITEFYQIERGVFEEPYIIKSGFLVTSAFNFPNIELTKHYHRKNLLTPEEARNFAGKKCALTSDTHAEYHYISDWKSWVKLSYSGGYYYRTDNLITTGHSILKIEIIDMYSGKPIRERVFPKEYFVQADELWDDHNSSFFIYLFASNSNGTICHLQVLDSALNNKGEKIILHDFPKKESLINFRFHNNSLYLFTYADGSQYKKTGKYLNHRIHRYELDGKSLGYWDIVDSVNLFNETWIENNYLVVRDHKYDSSAMCRCSFNWDSLTPSVTTLSNSQAMTCDTIAELFSRLDHLILGNKIVFTGIEQIPVQKGSRGVGSVIICDSSFQVLNRITCLTSTISQTYNPTMINDTIIAVNQIIYENTTGGISSGYSQAEIIFIDIRNGIILKRIPITTLGFNILLSMELDYANKKLRTIGLTNHYKVMNGPDYSTNANDADYFFLDINLLDHFSF